MFTCIYSCNATFETGLHSQFRRGLFVSQGGRGKRLIILLVLLLLVVVVVVVVVVLYFYWNPQRENLRSREAGPKKPYTLKPQETKCNKEEFNHNWLCIIIYIFSHSQVFHRRQPRTQACSRYLSDQRRLGTERDSPRRPRRIFPTSLTGDVSRDVTSKIAEDDWERGCIEAILTQNKELVMFTLCRIACACAATKIIPDRASKL